jgi:hypothetical protein
VTGINYGGGAEVRSAQSDLAGVYASLTARADIYGVAIASALDSTTRFPGVYYSPTYLTLGGQLTLDAQGDANAVFIFVRYASV